MVSKDRSRYLVHRVSARMETSFAGLTLEQHIGYISKATMEVPTEIEMSNVCAIAARTLRAWNAHRDANHNTASSHDVKRSAPGQERPRTRAFQTQGRRASMEALWGLAAWWHEQQLTRRTFWTAGIIDEIKGDILKARDNAFLMSYLDDVKKGNKEKAGAVEQERQPPGPPPPPPQSTPPPQLLLPAKEANSSHLNKSRCEEASKRQKEVGVI